MPVDSGWPASRFASLLDKGGQQNQNQLDADLQGWLSEEHKANGQHGTVVADSVTLNPPDPADALTGKLIIQDEDEKTTAIYRTRALSTVIEMMYGLSGSAAVATLFRYLDSSGVFTGLAKVGIVSHGSGAGNGIALLSRGTGLPDVFHDWSVISGDSNALPGARMLIGDITRNLSPVSLRWRNTGSGFYEWMKTTGGQGPTAEEVNLGSDLDSSKQGWWDHGYIRTVDATTGNITTINSTTGNITTVVATTGNITTVNSTTVNTTNLNTTNINGSAYPPAFTGGTWSDVSFNAGNFTADVGQTWTLTSGDQIAYAYSLIGKVLTVAFEFQTTSVSGACNYLILQIPGGYTSGGREHIDSVAWAVDNGSLAPTRAIIPASGTSIYFALNSGAPWQGSTDNTIVAGTIAFSIA